MATAVVSYHLGEQGHIYLLVIGLQKITTSRSSLERNVCVLNLWAGISVGTHGQRVDVAAFSLQGSQTVFTLSPHDDEEGCYHGMSGMRVIRSFRLMMGIQYPPFDTRAYFVSNQIS